MAVEAAGQIEFEQRHLNRAAGGTGQTDNLVDGHGRGPEQLLDEAQRIVAVQFLGREVVRDRRRAHGGSRDADGVDHIDGILDQGRSVPNQLVAALRARVERDPGTAMTSRPASAASRAVISEPERGAASTTTVPELMPAMIRLR
jgi:hypothetical protein